MAVNQDRIIKLHPKIVLAMIAFGVTGFFSLIFISNQQAKKEFLANYDTEIVSTLIAGEFGGGRGGIGYKKKSFHQYLCRFD